MNQNSEINSKNRPVIAESPTGEKYWPTTWLWANDNSNKGQGVETSPNSCVTPGKVPPFSGPWFLPPIKRWGQDLSFSGPSTKIPWLCSYLLRRQDISTTKNVSPQQHTARQLLPGSWCLWNIKQHLNPRAAALHDAVAFRLYSVKNGTPERQGRASTQNPTTGGVAFGTRFFTPWLSGGMGDGPRLWAGFPSPTPDPPHSGREGQVSGSGRVSQSQGALSSHSRGSFSLAAPARNYWTRDL